MSRIHARTIATATAVAASLLLSASALASDVSAGASAAQGSLGTFDVATIIKTVTNTLIFFIGAISVIVIIIAGLRYVVSGGNAASVQGAKNTLLYAIIGLVVSISAFAIVNYVLTAFHIL